MPRKPGGPASVKLYEDYRAYLEGRIQLRTKISHEAVGRPVKLAAPYSPMYPAAGAAALTDGKRAFPEYRDPRWQGFHGEDLDATIDLGKATEVRTVTAGFLRYVIAGIYLRAEVEVAVSDDGQEFRLVGTVKPESPPAQDDPTVRDVSIELKQVTARYVRVRARSLRTIPAGQPGAGEKAWLFVDEIAVNPALPK